MGKVLVLGSDTRSFLTVVRSLGRRGLEVHVAWCPATSPALASRYVARVHPIPAYDPRGQAWKAALTSLMTQEQFDLVIPCDDPTLIPLQHHRADLERLGRIYLLDERAYEIAFNKVKSHELAAALGIRVPRTVVATGPLDTPTVLSQLPLPLVVKPAATFTAGDLVNRGSVRKVRSPDQLAVCLTAACAQGPALVQEHFAGTGAGIELLADRGDILVAFQHMRVHEPLSGGGSSYRKSVALQPDLVAAAREIVCALDYRGVAMVEFRVNTRTGEWIFVEVNGRFWGSLPLAVSAGVDFPYYLYQLLVEGKRDFPQRYTQGLYCRNLWLDAVWLLQNLRADKTDPTLNTVPVGAVVGEIVNVLTLRERSDTFVRDDPKPGLVEMGQLAGRVWGKAVGKIRVPLLALSPIARPHKRRARAALRTARRVLFICRGNICRSPFAERYAQAVFPDTVTAQSCGYYPKEGRVSPDDAQATARQFGITLEPHRSKIITEDLVQWADVIFVFDEDNWNAVAKQYPAARGKLHFLGSLLPGGAVSMIRDPYGHNRSRFFTSYKTIAEALDAAVSARVPNRGESWLNSKG